MNKTKTMMTGFAVFASIIMLSTTCIAGPVKEKASIATIETAQKDLVNSLQELFLKIKEDRYLNSLADSVSEQISNDRALTRIESCIASVEDDVEKASLVDSYLDVLVNKEEFSDLQDYFESTYSQDLQDINNEFIEILETPIMDSDTKSEDLVPVGVIPFGSLDDDLEQQDLTISSSGDIVLMGEEIDPIISNDGDSSMELGSGEALYSGFLFNLDGGMFVPGYGWVYPDDPNWDDWYALHSSLQGLPMSYATAVLDVIVVFILSLFVWLPALLISLVVGVYAAVDSLVFLTSLWGPLGFVLGIPFGVFMFLLWCSVGIFFPFYMVVYFLMF